MVNISESLLNVVTKDKPKVLKRFQKKRIGLGQKCDKKSLIYLLQMM